MIASRTRVQQVGTYYHFSTVGLLDLCDSLTLSIFLSFMQPTRQTTLLASNPPEQTLKKDHPDRPHLGRRISDNQRLAIAFERANFIGPTR